MCCVYRLVQINGTVECITKAFSAIGKKIELVRPFTNIVHSVYFRNLFREKRGDKRKLWGFEGGIKLFVCFFIANLRCIS